MKAIVTGGCGFLGSHLVDRLVARGDEVVVVDNLWTGTVRWRNRRAEYVFCGAEELGTRDVSLAHAWADRTYHLASPASPAKYMADPVGTMRANFVGAMRLTEYLRPGGRFCFTSTSEVYGDPEVSPLPETYAGRVDCTGPRSSYDESKRATEALLHESLRVGSLAEIRCARIFNAYGPRTLPDDGRAVSNFIAAGLRGEPLVVSGDGSQTRCFTYVDCVVEGLLRYFDLPEAPSVMNIGCDRETTVLEVAQYVARELGARVEHGPPAPQDPRQRRPDLTRARLWMSDWDPAAVPYEEGIRRTVDHFRQEHGL